MADNLTRWGVESVAADGYLDDPYLSIARLARELAPPGLAVEEGDLVITGSLAGRRADVLPGEYRGVFGALAEVSVTLSGDGR